MSSNSGLRDLAFSQFSFVWIGFLMRLCFEWGTVSEILLV